MQLLGYKIKGLSYKKDSPRYRVPPGWPDSMDFGEFSGPSQAKVHEAKTILESLLIHHGYDPETHVVEDNNNEHKGRKKRRREEREKRKRQKNGQVKNGSDFEDILPDDEVNQND